MKSEDSQQPTSSTFSAAQWPQANRTSEILFCRLNTTCSRRLRDSDRPRAATAVATSTTYSASHPHHTRRAYSTPNVIEKPPALPSRLVDCPIQNDSLHPLSIQPLCPGIRPLSPVCPSDAPNTGAPARPGPGASASTNGCLNTNRRQGSRPTSANAAVIRNGHDRRGDAERCAGKRRR